MHDTDFANNAGSIVEKGVIASLWTIKISGSWKDGIIHKTSIYIYQYCY